MTHPRQQPDGPGNAPGFSIVVNGRPATVRDAHVTYKDVVAIAVPTPPTGTNIEIVVTYKNAQGPRSEGTLVAGSAVTVKKEGTIFNATPTDKS